MPRRQHVLAGLLVVIGLLALYLLSSVLKTVFFAITVAYVLYPLRQFLVRRGLGRRLSAAVSTLVAFLALLALVLPLVWALYQRRGAFVRFFQTLPSTLSVDVLGTTVVLEAGTFVSEARSALGDLAVQLGQAAPTAAFQAFLFVLLLYALLLDPNAAPAVVFRTVPEEYHDVVRRLHERIRQTLSALYVLQVLTALATFVLAYVLFFALGYPGAFGLAALAGILQFIPILGPSIIIVLIAATDVIAGDATRAVTVLLVGLLFVGFLPDAVIRSQMARYTTRLPASLYFVGFTGGVLSVGLVGLIAGPLIVALLLEVIELLGDGRGASVQQQLDDSVASRPEGGDGGTG